MYFLLGAALTLAFLLIVNMAAAVFASMLWHFIASPVRKLSVATRAKVIFGLRIFPVVAALVFVLAFVMPAYLILEPTDSGEVVSAKLTLIAGLCLIGVCVALLRVFKTWLVTHRLMANWLANSTAVVVDGVSLPIHRIEHAFPVLAVVGILRPRIFVAEKVLSSLSPEELRAAIAHEYGHLRARDNLKRTLLRVCRDLVMIPVGKGLDLAWAQNAEVVADEFAAVEGNVEALDLASALVKLTRIVPDGAAPTLPVGAYIITDREGDISSRIRRLLRLSDRRPRPRKARLSLIGHSFLWVVTAAGLLTLHLADQRLLLTTHDAIERFVWLIR